MAPRHRGLSRAEPSDFLEEEPLLNSDDTQATPTVRLRCDGAVDEETLAYARTKIDAVLGRTGLPAVRGEVRVVRAAAHHVDRPWSATADLRVGGRQVVVMAEEATGTALVDRLQDRLRRQTDKAAQAWDDGHRTTAPAWRGGSRPSQPASEDPDTA